MKEATENGADQVRALRPLALLATGSTGADIERLVREARGEARRKRRPLAWDDLERALVSLTWPRHETLDWLIAVHELGHAIVCTVLGIGIVDTVRIGGRGGEVSTSLDVSELQDDDGLMRLIAATLGGRAAEKLILGKVNGGSGGTLNSDLARATQLAIDAEASLGLGEDMPLVYRPPTNAFDALNFNPSLLRRVNRRLEAAEEMARGVLADHKDTLVMLAERLKTHRVLEGDEVVKALSVKENGESG